MKHTDLDHWLAVALAIAVLAIAPYASAVGKPEPAGLGVQEQTGVVLGVQDQTSISAALSGSQSDASAGAIAGATGGAADAAAYGQGGDASAAGGAGGSGVGSVSVGGSSHRSSAFVFASDLPQTTMDCVRHAAGGGGNGSGAGFIQLPLINHGCWMQTLAERERSVELQARLKCGDKRYRNAIVYYLPGRERQGACIGFVREQMLAMIEADRQAADDALNIALATARLECDEKIGRCEARLLGAPK